MDNTDNKKDLSSIYKNVFSNTNYLVSNFFKNNIDLAHTYFDDSYIEDRLSKNKTNIPVEFISTKIDMTKQSIYHTMNGQSKPTLEKVVSLSEFFNVPINEFVYTELKNNDTHNDSNENIDLTYSTTSIDSGYVLNDSTETLINSIADKLKVLSHTELQEVLDFVSSLQKDDKEITYK